MNKISKVLFIYPSWTGEYGLLKHFARRAGVYPGARRDARRTYKLDYPGWDR